MNLADILDSRSVLPNVKAQNKKQLLHELAHAASEFTGLPQHTILETLVRRETLGSTGLGQGIAIPHGKIRDLGQVFGLFARLAAPIDFDAVDNEPVDIVFLLLAPEHAGADHLKALARISRLLRDSETTKKLRGTDSAAGLYAILTEPRASASHAA
ncbi:PTS IIA-like nitrogen regulatory protein PtsN [soil metagenome]